MEEVNLEMEREHADFVETVLQSRSRVCNACGSSTHQRFSSRACPHNSNSLRMAARDPTRIPTERDDRGEMKTICANVKCRAMMWIDERASSSSKANPRFQMCCSKGSANIEHLKSTPALIASLLRGSDEKSKEFRANIRLYNSSLSFSSMGVKLDQSLANMRTGNYTFRIQGSPYHLIGSALPQDGVSPSFAQIYIYDSDQELNYRHSIFPTVNRDTLRELQELMHENPLIEKFKTMVQISEEQRGLNEGGGVNALDEVKLVFRGEGLLDSRRYNRPTALSEIAAIIVGGEGSSNDALTSSRDIIVYAKGDGTLTRINEKNQFYDPLHYVLLHPDGSPAWNINTMSDTGKKVSTMDFYSSRLMLRPNNGNLLHLYGKLYHQYIVDMYAKMEQGRLSFISLNQKQLRADMYKGLEDALTVNDQGVSLAQLGSKVILPSSFVGGPRHMAQNYHDAMSIVRRMGKPDLFITFTCNPTWPEITRELLDGQIASDRPDLCVRVFKMKHKQMLTDIVENKIFGRVIGYVYTIEFQKRGLPHAHMLFILHPEDKPNSPEDYDKMISAEFPDVNTHPLAYETVTKNMVHGPCGLLNPQSPCMKDLTCTKKFPKPFAPETTLNSTGGYPAYKRRDTGQSIQRTIVQGGRRQITVDNRWVVPYNLFLCTKYNAHINVESCASIDAIKYVFKYVYKGHDRASMTVEQNNEIKSYLDARYVSAPESCWRLFGFSMHKEYPPHQRLQVHEEKKQTVYYRESQNLGDVVNRAAQEETTLTAWMKMNAESEDARLILYPDFPEHYVWHTETDPKKWTKRTKGFTIGRIYAVSPKETEKYYLRMILYHIPGATCFQDLRTVNGTVYSSYQETAEALGLLESDNQWELCMSEASTFNSAQSLRNLFCVIVVFCFPSNAYGLFEKFRSVMSDDILHKLRNDESLDPVLIDLEDRSHQHCLLELNDILLAQYDYNLADYPGFTIPAIDTRHSDPNIANTPLLIREHQSLIAAAQARPEDIDISIFNEDQLSVYQSIIDVALSSGSTCPPNGKIFFVDGPGGTGKTFLFNSLLFRVRREGHIALSVASSGTAALLMDGGRTSHSMFKIPLEVESNTMCRIKPNSVTALLLKQTKLILWDESSMTSRNIFEAVDRTFRDIMRHENADFADIPFGGRLIVFGGDFRQILPVVRKGSRSDIIGQCINSSFLWSNVKVLKLRINMRVKQALSFNTELAAELQAFADKLLDIGGGKLQTLDVPSTFGSSCTDLIEIPPHMVIPGDNLIDLLKALYPDFVFLTIH
ncbi:unnamed protein product [Mucor hiemalis]